jgi:hypothetical protein
MHPRLDGADRRISRIDSLSGFVRHLVIGTGGVTRLDSDSSLDGDPGAQGDS